ncbi:MAG: MFS transporter, partial [FCB group bacterium]|nr:MFS transporter [FCB group bacterium]
KGLMTGIAAAGFGVGAMLLSFLSETILSSGKNVLQLFIVIGTVYGILIFTFAHFIPHPGIKYPADRKTEKEFFYMSGIFYMLLTGIFLGTFAGLLIIGSLMMIGEQNNISEHTLILGVSFFAVANFAGRLFWGFISDHMDAALSIFLALVLQACAIVLLGVLALEPYSFILLTLLTGFGFSANFVLFAKKTAVVFGVERLGNIYPFVFLGYAIAGVFGPLTGGLLFDRFGNFTNAATLAALFSLTGGLIFLTHYLKTYRRIRSGR